MSSVLLVWTTRSSKIRKSFNTALLIGQFAASMLPGAHAVVLLGKLAKGKDVSFADVFFAATSFISGGGSGKIVGKVFGAFASGTAKYKAAKKITRAGVRRTNACDWRKLRDWWDEAGYGHILSDADRKKIAKEETPLVDDDWISGFPGDAHLVGERIPMHHIDASSITVPLPQSRHLDAHMPGGYRYNRGGPGQSG